jgi:hypothetical protein
MAELATINACFWGGIVVATLVQVRLRPLARPGRALIVILAVGPANLAAMGAPISFAGRAVLSAIWGVGAGVARLGLALVDVSEISVV